MEKLTTAAQIISMVSFFFYGASCLLSKRMIIEFERYRMSQYRIITGALQILASIGLMAGFFETWFAVLASAGLAVQMLCGVAVRIRIKDSLFQTSPAVFFCILNLFIFYRRFLEI